MASKERQIQRWKRIEYPSPINLNCIICEYNDLNDNFEKLYSDDIFYAGKLIRHKCPNCGLIFGDLRVLNLSEKEINDDYEDVYSYFTEGNTYQYVLNSLNSINIFKNKNLLYLDYACGTGSILPILKNEGYNIYGYDK